MFLRSKIQEVILRRRSRCAGAQRSHVPDQAASSSTVPCDGDSGGAGADAGGGSKSPAARSLFASPRLLHSSSLPAGTFAFAAKSPTRDAESETAFSTMSPTSVLDAAAAFVPRTDGVGASKRRLPWKARDNNGLADALDCSDQQQERIVLAATSSSSSLVRSCSLDRRVEFGVKNKSSWLPLRASSGREATSPEPADPREIIEPSSEDYTCVISRGPNPRTVHIFGDRVVEGGDRVVDGGASAAATTVERESSPRPINLPARGDGGFFSL